MTVGRTASVILLVLVTGCQSRLDFQRTSHVEAASIHSFEISPPRYDQKVSVTIGTNAPVKVHVYLTKDKEAVEKVLTLKGKSDKTLADWTGDSSGAIKITIPAHQVAIVRIEAELKAADVDVKVAAQ
jgi:hypothetical protein